MIAKTYTYSHIHCIGADMALWLKVCFLTTRFCVQSHCGHSGKCFSLIKDWIQLEESGRSLLCITKLAFRLTFICSLVVNNDPGIHINNAVCIKARMVSLRRYVIFVNKRLIQTVICFQFSLKLGLGYLFIQ